MSDAPLSPQKSFNRRRRSSVFGENIYGYQILYRRTNWREDNRGESNDLYHHWFDPLYDGSCREFLDSVSEENFYETQLAEFYLDFYISEVIRSARVAEYNALIKSEILYAEALTQEYSEHTCVTLIKVFDLDDAVRGE